MPSHYEGLAEMQTKLLFCVSHHIQCRKPQEGFWQFILQIIMRACDLQVNLKGVVSTVVVTTLVLEGWSTKLNPNIRILDTLKRTLPRPYAEHLRMSAEVLFNESGISS